MVLRIENLAPYLHGVMKTNLPSAAKFTDWLRTEPEWCRAVIRSSTQYSAGLLGMMSLCADDIVSDVTVRMQKNSRVFTSRNDLGRYLARCTTNWIRSLARKHEVRTRRGFHDFNPPELDSLSSSGSAADPCLRDEYVTVAAWMKQDEDGTRLLDALHALLSAEKKPTTSALVRVMGCPRREVEKLLRSTRSRARIRFLR